MKKPQSYKDLEVYSLAIQLAVRLHKITIEKLPKFEMFEEGSQVGRSSKSDETIYEFATEVIPVEEDNWILGRSYLIRT